MEDKLLELKEQFCKWYCPNQQKQKEPCNGRCGECSTYDKALCTGEFCKLCMVSDYIKFIRDEL